MAMSPASGLSCPVIMRNSVVLPAPVGTDDADNAAGRQLEAQIVDQQLVAKTLRQIGEFDDVVAKAFGDRNDDLGRGRRLVVLPCDEIVIALDTRLGLGLPGFGTGGDPLAFRLDGALARLILAAFLLQALLLLLEPARIIALVGNAAAAIQLQNSSW